MATITTLNLQELHPTRAPSSANTSFQALRENPDEIERESSARNQSSDAPSRPASNLHTFLIVFQLCTINFLASFTNGIITVGLPTIAGSIALPRSLYLWPSSVYGLTSGATLLLAGSIADLIGARTVDIGGCVVLSVFTLACGVANTGIQLVIFRAFQGIGMSMHLPASVSLVAAAVPQGKSRNVSFGCLGLSQPLGFSAGLVISGIMIEKAGWRSGFYLSGAALVMATVACFWSLPHIPQQPAAAQQVGRTSQLARLWSEIDWIGGVIASAGLAILSYVLALLSADLSAIHKPSGASLLAISLVLLLSFPIWMHRRERSGKPALIPNALWKKTPFTSTCVMVALSYGAMNAMELFSSLYFQEIQNTSTLFTSLRLLPNLLIGTIINLTVGMFVDKVSARWLVAVSSMLCAGAPLLMALVNPDWSYWYMEFWAQTLSPMSGDVLFTVGLLIISDEFPEKMQALAGAVFNTVAQFGMSLGITVCQVAALAISSREERDGNVETGLENDALLKGYQASFWSMFAFLVTCTFIAIWGLRKAGKVGVKRD
jgi:MFS family permease